MKRFLQWLSLDTPLYGLGQGHSLTIEPPDPSAQGGGHSATIEIDPDEPTEGDEFQEEDKQLPDTRSSEDREEERQRAQDRTPQSRFKSHDEAEGGYRHLQVEKDRLSTQFSALERQVQVLTTQSEQQTQARGTTEHDELVKRKAN